MNSPRPLAFLLLCLCLHALGLGPVDVQFSARVVEPKSDSGIDMIQALKRQFPELKNADSNTVAAFLERRADQSVPGHPERE